MGGSSAVIITASLEPADSMLVNFCQCFTITSAQKVTSSIFVPKPQARDFANWQSRAVVRLAIGVWSPNRCRGLDEQDGGGSYASAAKLTFV